MCTVLRQNRTIIMNSDPIMEESINSGRFSCSSSVVSDCDSGPFDYFDFDIDTDWGQMPYVRDDCRLLHLMQVKCDHNPESNKKTANRNVTYNDNSVADEECKIQTKNGAQHTLAVLNYEQVTRLNEVMNEIISIQGRGNFPTLEIRLKDLVKIVRRKLETDEYGGIHVRDIRLNGGAASHILASEPLPYNDLDLIFNVELSSNRDFERVKLSVLKSLYDMLPAEVNCDRISTCSLKEAYVSKMVKVNHNVDGDQWSLIALGNSHGRDVELKFVDTMRRQFEFSVDSFQIVLDSLLLFYECSQVGFKENFYPTIVAESVYGDFQEALYHLQKKLISTRHPEEIRGGGLLKYCNLLVKNYVPADEDDIKTLQRYMCSRFFIDFPDLKQQRQKLRNYLWNHFVGEKEEELQHRYLVTLYNVVEESTVCLMGHERRSTLQLIKTLAWDVLSQNPSSPIEPPPVIAYTNAIIYTPSPEPNYNISNSWMS